MSNFSTNAGGERRAAIMMMRKCGVWHNCLGTCLESSQLSSLGPCFVLRCVQCLNSAFIKQAARDIALVKHLQVSINQAAASPLL